MSELRKYLTPDNMGLSGNDVAIAKGNYTRFTMYPEELTAWYLKSEYFHNLTPAEKALAYKALKITNGSGVWHIGLTMDDGDGSLFPFENATTVVQSDEYDAMVLSGALGADLLDESKDFENDDTKVRPQEDEAYPLSRLVALGALSRSRESFLSIGASFVIEEADGRERYIGVGGDMHGDFCMVETIGAKGKTMAPNGLTVPFSPIEPNYIYGYHSVELDITEICLRHATVGMEADDRSAYFQRIMAAGNKTEEALRTRAFGDYGTSLEHRFWLVDDQDPLHNGKTVESMMVKPGSQAIKLDVRSMPDGVLFAQTQRKSDDEQDGTYEDIATIFIPDEFIPQFIITLRDSDMGRVAPYEIEELARQMLMGKNYEHAAPEL